MTFINKRHFVIFVSIAVLLTIPLVAMFFTDQVNWSLSDFVVAGVLLLGTGILIDLALQKLKTSRFKIVLILLILFVFLLIWMELAVGIFGTPIAGS